MNIIKSLFQKSQTPKLGVTQKKVKHFLKFILTFFLIVSFSFILALFS